MDQGQLRWAILDIFRKEAGPRWSLWRPLCGFGNFGNNIENFRFFWEILKVLRFWKIMCHDFQSRRPIMTLGGVHTSKTNNNFPVFEIHEIKYCIAVIWLKVNNTYPWGLREGIQNEGEYRTAHISGVICEKLNHKSSIDCARHCVYFL